MTSSTKSTSTPKKSTSEYKNFENKVRAAAVQWFKDEGHTPHANRPYCLTKHEKWHNNIICHDVAEYIRQEKTNNLGNEPFPLHNYLHHGLSSQAMAFNLIGPLIIHNNLAPLQLAIEAAGVTWPTGNTEAWFEHSDRDTFKEEHGQPTSLDIVVHGIPGPLFIEAKYVEKEFGGCSVFARGDCEGGNPFPNNLHKCYLHHIGRTYWKCMQKFGITEAPLVTGAICPFANYYQFYREVLFALANNGCFVLLYDARNPAFVRPVKDTSPSGGLWPFLVNSLPDQLRHRVGKVSIQSVVQAIEDSGNHAHWLESFKSKYGLKDPKEY